VNETADVGEGILSELDRQKDVIAHTHENVNGINLIEICCFFADVGTHIRTQVRKVNDDLKTSNTMLNKMGKWWRKL
jgi:hypothetical protein